MAFFKPGERKKRPGVYLRIVNRGAASSEPAAIVQPTPIPPVIPPDDPDGITVAYNSTSRLVVLNIPGCTVTHDGNGTVTLSGLTVPVTDDDNGNITIGG